MAAQSKRERYCGTAEALADIICKYALDKSFVRYAEKIGGKVEPVKLVQNKNLIMELRALQWNLAFRKMTMVEAMEIVYKRNKAQIKIDDEDVVDWVATLAARIRVMCSHVAKAERRNPNARPLWWRMMPWTGGGDSRGAEAAEGDEHLDGAEAAEGDEEIESSDDDKPLQHLKDQNEAREEVVEEPEYTFGWKTRYHDSMAPEDE